MQSLLQTNPQENQPNAVAIYKTLFGSTSTCSEKITLLKELGDRLHVQRKVTTLVDAIRNKDKAEQDKEHETIFDKEVKVPTLREKPYTLMLDGKEIARYLTEAQADAIKDYQAGK